MNGTIILQGITLDDFMSRIKEEIRAEISHNETKKVSPMSYTEVCEALGITNKTLMKVRIAMNLTLIYPSDIDRILLKYPKYIKKSIRA